MQFDIASFTTPPPPVSTDPAGQTADLLRQILDVQREHLAHARAAHDQSARWRILLGRWKQDFPELPEACRQAMPILERAFGGIIAALVDELRQAGPDGLDNDFAMQDFLDRHVVRLGQLGTLFNLVGPLAEASQQIGSDS